jgi:hypothetical protein
MPPPKQRDALAELRTIQAQRQSMAVRELLLVRNLRRYNTSWEEIARALGVNTSSAHRRFWRKLDDDERRRSDNRGVGPDRRKPAS